MNGQSQEGGPGMPQQGIMDSITLGQLRAMVGSVPKPKVIHIIYMYLPDVLTKFTAAMVVRLQLRR